MLCTNPDSHCEEKAHGGTWGNDLLTGASPNGWQHDSSLIQAFHSVLCTYYFQSTGWRALEDWHQLVQTASFRKNLKQNQWFNFMLFLWLTLPQKVNSKMWLLTGGSDSETAALAGETFKGLTRVAPPCIQNTLPEDWSTFKSSRG